MKNFTLYLFIILILFSNGNAFEIGTHLRDFGATLNGSGIGDSTALETVITRINSGVIKSKHIYFDGNLTLTRVPPNLDRIHIHGDEMLDSIVSKKYSGLWYFRWEGRPGYSGGGLHNLAIPSDVFTPNSYMIILRATSSGYAPDSFEMENLYLASGTGVNAPYRVIDISGTARVSPIGIRQIRMKNVTTFGAVGGCAIYMDGTVDFLSWGLRTYPGAAPYGTVILGSQNINAIVQ